MNTRRKLAILLVAAYFIVDIAAIFRDTWTFITPGAVAPAPYIPIAQVLGLLGSSAWFAMLICFCFFMRGVAALSGRPAFLWLTLLVACAWCALRMAILGVNLFRSYFPTPGLLSSSGTLYFNLSLSALITLTYFLYWPTIAILAVSAFRSEKRRLHASRPV